MAGKSAWHTQTAEQVLTELQATPEGLSEAEVEQRLLRYGPNRLPASAPRAAWLRFLRHFHNVLIYVLLGAAAITASLGHITDTLVILAVVLINALIGFLQEGKAERAMNAIRHLLALRAAVIRAGQRHSASAEMLVPGDIVLLEAGDKVPADVRLLKVHGLQIHEAILTGESLPVDKQLGPVAPDTTLGDRTCMAYSGTSVTSGQGRGVVVATGKATEIGCISGMLAQVEPLNTPLLAQMSVFARWLTLFILIIAALMLLFGTVVLDHAFADLFLAVIGLSVAAIPEGLPAVLTITLAVGVQAMARRNAIVRRLPAIETLGSVSVICSDKTGTLTCNVMAVDILLLDDTQLEIGGAGYEPEGTVSRAGLPVRGPQMPVLKLLGCAAALCNDAELQRKQDVWCVEGDPMEGALLALAGKTGWQGPEAAQQWRRTDVIPFDTRHRFMATLNHDHEGHAFIFVKGAPETLLALCCQQYDKAGIGQPIDRAYWHTRAGQIAAQGRRVLALAARPLPPEHTVLEYEDLEAGLVLLGLVGLIDPPRPEAIAAVAECQQAGIDVKMVTGDHVSTAKAIAEQLGLQHSDGVLTGAELEQLDDSALAQVIPDIGIFARTTPEHKLRLVMALQANKLTVAMTGDGVNDAPALKRADVGIAMGKSGSEAAKEAAEIVLADDNFASITAAVREGRTVYDNIKKVISWTLPTNAGEALTIIAALLLGLPLPITPVQILWVNMITAVTLGIALAFEPTEHYTMRRPPRLRSEPLLSGRLVWYIVLVSGLFLLGVFGIYEYAIERGYSEELARTLAMNTLVTLEIFQLLFIRNINAMDLTWRAVRGTRTVWLAIGTVVLGQLAVTYLPWFQQVFQTENIAPLELGVILIIGMLLFVTIETEKQLWLRVFGP